MALELQFFGSETNQKTILKHPVGLFVLFFTEMWERFSYYGMRGILVLFLTSELINGGFGWSVGDAIMLYGWYTGLVYLTPIIGGWIADNRIGLRPAVVLGALLMTLGHASLAFETITTFYLGLGLLVVGNGFFKPNISSMVGQMYPKGSVLKDSAYTIFYMGINAGAFLGILICGWLGETKGWSYGFGCAGIFMFFGMLQFWFGQKIFGKIGEKPENQNPDLLDVLDQTEEEKEPKIPFTQSDMVFGISSLVALVAAVICWLTIELQNEQLKYLFVIPFIVLVVSFIRGRLRKFPKVEGDRLGVVVIFSFFTVFFWLAFEQAGGSMTIFADKFTDRTLDSAVGANIFRYTNLLMTLIPMGILTWVLFQLGRHVFGKFPLTIIFTAISFVIIWVLIYMINYENFVQEAPEVEASWYGILNSFFIISLAPMFSNLWLRFATKGKPISAPVKFALGIALVGVGFLALVIGSSSIPEGAKTAQVSMIWLVLAYFFHTVGELCVSPVGLSLVSKLSPERLIGLMFGVWFLANFVANFLAGFIGSFIEDIPSLSNFFTIFVVSSFVASVSLLLLSKTIKRMMHGVE